MATTISESARRIGNIPVGKMCSRMLPRLSIVVALCSQFVLLSHGWAVETVQTFKAGKYEGLMLAVDREGNLSGYYRETQGEGVTKTCAFYLKGKAADSEAKISTWSDQVFPGVIKTAGTDVNLKIEKGREFPGCGLVLMPEIAQGITFDKTFGANWNDLKIIASDRAYLFSEPSTDKKLKSYLIKNDVVGTLSRNGDWVQVEFPREGKKSISGWIKSSDIRDLSSPGN
jgi:hypothetical protein